MRRDGLSAVAREYPAGAVICEEKETGNCMYVIRSGRVKIFRRHGQGELVLAFLEPGDFFGEMALLEGLPRSATAVTVEPSVLIEVNGSTFAEMVRRNTEIAVRMLQRLASRVRDLDRRLDSALVESALGRALEVLRWLTPRGILDGNWVRVKGAARQLDLATQAGLPPEQREEVIERLKRARCLRIEGDDYLVATQEVLDPYAAYLELKRQYDPLLCDPTAEAKRENAMREAVKFLVTTLNLSPEEVEAQQAALAAKYERYLELKDRFGDVVA